LFKNTEKTRKTGMSKTFDIPFLCIFAYRQRPLIDKTLMAGYGESKRGGNEPEPGGAEKVLIGILQKYKIKERKNGTFKDFR